MRPPLIPIVYEFWEQFIFLQWAMRALLAWARWRTAQLRLRWLYRRMRALAKTDPRLFICSQQAAMLRRTMRRQYKRHAQLMSEEV